MAKLSKLADWVGEKLYAAHRGVFVEQDRLIIFGNDGIKDPKVTQVVEMTLAWIRKKGYRVEGLASCSGGFSWVIVVDPGDVYLDVDVDVEAINEMLWKAWGKVNGALNEPGYPAYMNIQLQKADETILDRPRLPRSVLKKRARADLSQIPA